MSIVLQDAVFKQFRDFIYDISGIFIADTKKYLLENRLLRRIQEKNLTGFDDYLEFLRRGTKDELNNLFDAITTNETYFFREPQQLGVFIDNIVPRVIEKKKNRDIKIWSAACSSGEEPYNIAMLLMEKTPDVRMDVMGSDISNEVLNSAKKAVYTSYSVRNIPALYMTRFFKNSGQSYELMPSVRNAVKFMNINLVDERKMKTVRGIDVIFCRNVLIYFDDKAKQKVVSHLYDSLVPGGFLFIGTSESLHNITRAFMPVVINNVVVYQKR